MCMSLIKNDNQLITIIIQYVWIQLKKTVTAAAADNQFNAQRNR